MANGRALSSLTNQVLVRKLEVLIREGYKLDAEMLRFIGEVDRRRLYREHACSSMFSFCTERLGMSEDAAYKRIRVARAARALPIMLQYLESGRIHISGLSVLAAHLTAENAKVLLARAAGKSKRQIEVIVRELAPKPDVAASIRKVSVVRPAALTPFTQVAPAPVDGPVATPVLPSPRKAARITPLAPTRYHVKFTASEKLKNNLDRAKELAGFGAKVEDLFEQAMELLVEKLDKDRLGVAGHRARKKHNHETRAPTRSRYIAKAVKREVFDRDNGRCTYVDNNDHRCTERHSLQLDHVVPHALGGESTANNLRLLCGPHNGLHAEECFGPLFIAQRREAPTSAKNRGFNVKSTERKPQ